ncbi:MAG: hypothetical protein K2Q18_04835 [Bdellovibrionales bacterium]|nr:hypothetical protein [Bdellovibrionales bacterium]
MRPFGKKEISIFLIANIVFIGSDIGAIQNGFFKFTNPDLLGLPYWEFVAWGFWVLYGYRILPKQFPTNLSLKALVLAIVFSQSFALIHQKEILLAVSAVIAIISLVSFRKIYDFYYFGFFALVGISVETTGLVFKLWTYPDADITIACIQFVVMWAGVGVFIPNIVGPLLLDKRISQPVFRNFFATKSVKNDHSLALKSIAGIAGLQHTFEDFLQMSDMALKHSNARKAIECLREALYSAQNPMERARAHLLMSQSYRMLIQMRNARKEIESAFIELDMEVPKNYPIQTAKAFLLFLKSKYFPSKVPVDSELVKLKVALYEEIGLAGYYLREDAVMIQASLGAYKHAKLIGPSIEMINWIGGTMCVFILKGWSHRVPKLRDQAEQVLKEINDPAASAKWQLWQALALDYSGDSHNSAESFRNLLTQKRSHLRMHDLKLSALTLSCNYLLRGHFKESAEAVEYIFEDFEAKNCNFFSQTRPFVSWYKIGAGSYILPLSELEETLKSSKAIFSQQDHEKWAITQYIGNMLFYTYINGSRDTVLINELEKRFQSLGFKPKDTYIEAAFFWFALALVRLEQFSNKEIGKKQMEDLLAKIKRLPAHPVFKQHFRVLEERFLIIESRGLEYKFDAEFENLLVSTDNRLALVEYHRNKLFFELKKYNALSETIIIDFHTVLKKYNWPNYSLLIQKWVSPHSKKIKKDLQA